MIAIKLEKDTSGFSPPSGIYDAESFILASWIEENYGDGSFFCLSKYLKENDVRVYSRNEIFVRQKKNIVTLSFPICSDDEVRIPKDKFLIILAFLQETFSKPLDNVKAIILQFDNQWRPRAFYEYFPRKFLVTVVPNIHLKERSLSLVTFLLQNLLEQTTFCWEETFLENPAYECISYDSILYLHKKDDTIVLRDTLLKRDHSTEIVLPNEKIYNLLALCKQGVSYIEKHKMRHITATFDNEWNCTID